MPKVNPMRVTPSLSTDSVGRVVIRSCSGRSAIARTARATSRSAFQFFATIDTVPARTRPTGGSGALPAARTSAVTPAR